MIGSNKTSQKFIWITELIMLGKNTQQISFIKNFLANYLCNLIYSLVALSSLKASGCVPVSVLGVFVVIPEFC